jgi:uncharacterized membrane protein
VVVTQFQSEKAQVVIGSFGSYAEAERAVDQLSDQQFPVEHTAIVGRGLTTVEQVTGRLTMKKAGLQGLASGALLGAVLGWLFGLFNWVNPLISGLLLAAYGAVIAAFIGGALGVLGHALTGGRRDFTSTSSMRAETYDVLVAPEHAERARAILATPRG